MTLEVAATLGLLVTPPIQAATRANEGSVFCRRVSLFRGLGSTQGDHLSCLVVFSCPAPTTSLTLNVRLS